jgi:predicted CXXCH cytochrome family protein
MRRSTLAAWLATVLLYPPAGAALGAADPASAQEVVARCLGCHDYGADAPVHQVLLGSHGIAGDAQDMAHRRGCADCHGDSEAHVDAPREHAPDTSFGPRWNAGAAAQDQRCLDCHEQGNAANWRHALHMVNGLTCVTCHDIHAEEDRVLFEEQQVSVCTTCHKAQRSGIHGLAAAEAAQPACSLCHNPHDHEDAGSRMRQNTSAGCAFCHDQSSLSVVAAVNPRAGNYHRVMATPERSCIDCHQGISHAPSDSAPPIHPQAVRGRTVTLFHPGYIDRDWLLREHPGSQPLRQGMHCQRCHRGDEAALGAGLGGDVLPAHRDIGLAFALQSGVLRIDIRWPGDATDRHLALMWGPGDGALQHGGCFTACHRPLDAPAGGHDPRKGAGMGGAALPGRTTRLWRIPLQGANAAGDDLPADLEVTRRFEDGQWQVSLRLPPGGGPPVAPHSHSGRYTLGVALHGEANPGGAHWVSLPMTLGFGGTDTDFIAE